MLAITSFAKQTSKMKILLVRQEPGGYPSALTRQENSSVVRRSTISSFADSWPCTFVSQRICILANEQPDRSISNLSGKYVDLILGCDCVEGVYHTFAEERGITETAST